MTEMTAKNDRSLRFQLLTKAVRLQIRFWDACETINEVFGENGPGAISLVDRISREHAGKQLRLSDLATIQAGLGEINPADAVPNLSDQMLLSCLQNAVHLQSELHDAATLLAKAMGFTQREALESVCAIADCAIRLDGPVESLMVM